MTTRNKNELVVRDKATGDLQIIDMNTGELISSSSKLDLDAKAYKFSYEKALLICQSVAEGATMAQLGENPDFPPLHVINHWQRTERMFAAELIIARKTRADHFHDKVVEIAGNAANLMYREKEDIANAKLAADQYKWLADKGNPEKYSSKVVHEGSTDKPITMRVINTGIDRSKPDIETTSKEVQDDEEKDDSNRDTIETEVLPRGEVRDVNGAERDAIEEDNSSGDE